MTAKHINTLLFVLYALTVVATLTILSWHADFSVDDMFITFRYADHFLKGEGLVWNTGERVEGYSSLLMVLMLSGLHWLGVGYVVAAKLLGILGFAGLIAGAHLYWRKTYKQGSYVFVSLIGSILIAVNYPLIVWAMGGLETDIFTALVCVAVVLLLLQDKSKHADRLCIVAGAIFGIAMLARPEAPLFAVISAIYVLFAKKKKNPSGALLLLAPFVLIAAAHIAWRYGYYGEFLPNTYYAKLSGEMTGEHLLKGLRYIWEFMKAPPYMLVYLLAVVPFMLKKSKHRRENLYLFAMIALYLLYVVYAGGDWMKGARLIVPVIPLMVMLLLNVTVQHMDTPASHSLLAGMAVLLLCFAQKSYYYTAPMAKYPYYWDRIAEYIRTDWKSDSLIAINMAGQIPYLTPKQRYIDMLGINDRHIAKQQVVFASGKGNIGHYKGDGKYVLSRKPDYIIMRDGFTSDISPEGVTFVSEKEIAASPEFKRLYRRKTVSLRLPDTAPIPEKTFKFKYLERVAARK
ncbi:MAG: hypothetical protein EB060_05410 [Proteobacteria bacterium]|nr:hypothetical protein [Pseudomonadota bacterium]